MTTFKELKQEILEQFRAGKLTEKVLSIQLERAYISGHMNAIKELEKKKML